MPSPLKQQYEKVLSRLQHACQVAGRNQDVALLAVSKGHPATAVHALSALGQRAFGENYLQDALAKIEQLKSLDLEWHYIGGLQSNKTRAVAEHFSWVQSVDRLKIAQRLNDQRPKPLPPLQVLIQVNIDDEPQKSGVASADALSLAAAIDQLPRLNLRGIMGIPSADVEAATTQQSFFRLKALYDQLSATYDQIDTLSMGMSGDLETAVAAGSTMVRIGTDIFGPRQYAQKARPAEGSNSL
ncbi:MAG: YggS family pyridoxal phosphate-dependent enzyme [Xanthomonadales bacterium]|nr:YggS family pyridoxal phosphate-dependent enzyme [Xanthomonadales bacterium]